MKQCIFIITILTLSFITVYAQNIEDSEDLNWLDNLEKAQEISKEKELPIFVDFTGSDWCGWCIKLTEEVFSQEEFIQYSTENLVLVKLDFPRAIPQTDATKAYNENLSLKEAAVLLGFLGPEDFDKLVNPKNMLRPKK